MSHLPGSARLHEIAIPNGAGSFKQGTGLGGRIACNSKRGVSVLCRARGSGQANMGMQVDGDLRRAGSDGRRSPRRWPGFCRLPALASPIANASPARCERRQKPVVSAPLAGGSSCRRLDRVRVQLRFRPGSPHEGRKSRRAPACVGLAGAALLVWQITTAACGPACRLREIPAGTQAIPQGFPRRAPWRPSGAFHDVESLPAEAAEKLRRDPV